MKISEVSGINPKTKKKETDKFSHSDKGFKQGENKALELKKLGYTKTEHLYSTELSNIFDIGL